VPGSNQEIQSTSIPDKSFLLRAFIGRRPDDHILRRVVRRFRNTRLARMVFGPVHGDALDPDELD
jgi:hypothetical protein